MALAQLAAIRCAPLVLPWIAVSWRIFPLPAYDVGEVGKKSPKNCRRALLAYPLLRVALALRHVSADPQPR